MIVCPECGTRNPAGTQFCGECGTFLEWAGDDAATNTAASTSTSNAQAQGGGGTTTATPVSPPAPDTKAAPLPPRPPEPEPLAPRPPEPKPAPAPAPPEPVREKDTGIRLVQPDEQQRRYVKTTDEPVVETPGDIECANCGVGNLATRKFCRSCGHLLARPVEEQKKKSWWRRLWDRITGRGRRYEVGTRRIQRGSGWLRPLIAVLLIGGLGVAMFTVLPTRTYLNQFITAIRDRFGDPVPVRAISVEASSSSRGAAPSQIVDGASNRFWSPAKAKGGDGQWIEASFEQPVRLLNVIITPGVSKDQEKFISQGRPRDVVITTTDDDNEQKSFPFVVQDKPGGQTFQVKASSVKKVRMTILSCYDAKNTELCAVGELEFRKRG